MEYVIPGVLVVLLVAGFVTYLVLNATRKSGSAAREGGPGIGQDPTPLGDTSEHAGTQTEQGETTGEQDADSSGGTGRPVTSGPAESSTGGERAAAPGGAAHVARPGEGEGRQHLEFEDDQPRPASERLADHER